MSIKRLVDCKSDGGVGGSISPAVQVLWALADQLITP